jgi:deazaflavin-dependent oxidoreductase (nitroreductase family)
MDTHVWQAIQRGLTCDITTTGRKSGEPKRIEIWYFLVGDQVYITGTPGRRDWYANILVHPEIIFHVKQGAHADLPARAAPITDRAERQRIMGDVMRNNSYFSGGDLDAWVEGSPLIAIEFI